ncbi:MAG: DUF4136 domain-containing protein [Myxococcota bacterium]|nr:DUF4136 domain-containing protein [Myxococcota bacterium]
MDSQKKSLLFAAFLFTVWTLSCASPMKTGFDVDPAADLSQYKMFAWVGPGPLTKAKEGTATASFISPLDDQRIRSSVNRTLEKLGYWLAVSPDVPDMVLAYSVGSEDKVHVHQSPGMTMTPYPYYGQYRYGGWHSTSSVSVQQYTEGTLSIEVYDSKTEQAVWVGWASKRLSRSDDSRAVISEAVSKILKEFPPARDK